MTMTIIDRNHDRLPLGLLLLSIAAASACGTAEVPAGTGTDEPDSAPAPLDARRPTTEADAGPSAADVTRAPEVAPDTAPDAGAPDARSDAGAGPAGDAGTSPDGAPASGSTTARLLATVFSPTVLHQIDITVEPRYLMMLDTDRVNRVPATFTYDGTTFANVGLRKKGSYGSYAPLAQKPAFTVKLDAFTAGQKLQGLDKLALGNCRQDATLVAMHLGYELYRRAGLAAPLTAHAVVTFNGVVKGVYVVEEATDKDFLRRNFGTADDTGNLYEGGYLGDVDFVNNPERLDLKREKEEARSRADIMALAALVKATPVATWAATIGAKVDLAGFMTGYAIDGLTNHWDSYPYNANNYYLYHRRSDDRFVFIPHGMDSLFRIDVVFGARALMDVHATAPPPSGSCRACGLDGDFARRLRAVPALDAQYRAEVQRVLREAWDLPVLFARIDAVGKLLHDSKQAAPAFLSDVKGHDQHRDAVRKFLTDRKAQLLQAPGP